MVFRDSFSRVHNSIHDPHHYRSFTHDERQGDKHNKESYEIWNGYDGWLVCLAHLLAAVFINGEPTRLELTSTRRGIKSEVAVIQDLNTANARDS